MRETENNCPNVSKFHQKFTLKEINAIVPVIIAITITLYCI